MTKMAKVHTLFLTKTAENHTLWGRTYLYSRIRKYPTTISFPRAGKPLGHITSYRNTSHQTARRDVISDDLVTGEI